MLMETVVALLIGTFVHATEPVPQQGDDISVRKAELTAMFDSRIQSLNEAKTCVAGAATRDALQACHQALKQDRMEMKEMRKHHRAEKLDKRIQKLEAKKQKLEDKKE